MTTEKEYISRQKVPEKKNECLQYRCTTVKKKTHSAGIQMIYDEINIAIKLKNRYFICLFAHLILHAIFADGRLKAI